MIAQADNEEKIILIIEDAPEDRVAYRRFLFRSSDFRCRIIEAESGNHGLDLWRSQRPDCVLLDFQLPDHDGLSMLKSMIEENGPNASAIVMLTGTGDTRLAVEAMKSGAHDYLDKNRITPDALLHAITNAIEKASLRRQVENQREWLHTTLRSIGDAVIATDTESRIAFMNPIAETLTGWPWAVAQGRPVQNVFRTINDNSSAGQESPFESAMQILDNVGLVNESTLRTRDGSLIPIDECGSPIRDRRGKLLGAVMVFRDISERKKFELEREALLQREKRARAAAEQANRLKDEFLATISHELRTPLNHMLGWLQMLRGGRLTQEESARALDTVERNARLQNRLIQDLLDVSRIITGKLKIDPRPLHFNQIIEAAIDAIKPSADAKNIILESDLDPQADRFTGDPVRLQQVIWNLLSNAVKFTPPTGRVSLRSFRKDSHVGLTVSDTGKGIRPDFLPYVFNRFSQEDGSFQRKHGGLGLGLAIVRHLVEAHGGDVLAESAGEGQGAHFTITLPLRPLDDGQHSLRDSLSDFNGFSNESLLFAQADLLKNLCVLVVDCEEDARQQMREILQPTGVTIYEANGMQEALKILGESSCDLLISDISMLQNGGFELIIEARRRGFVLPAIALTAMTDSSDRMQALATGYQMHLPKPIDPTELILAVASLTGRLTQQD